MNQSRPITFEEKLSDTYNCKMQKSSTGLDVCVAKEPCRWALSTLNGKYCRDPSIPLMDISNCRVRVDSTGVAKCMVAKNSCKFSLPHEDARICVHPLTTNQIACRLELDFGKIKWIREDIAEVIVNEGVELNEKHVEKLHDALISHYKAPFSVLVNKVNSYSYAFCALTKFGTIPEIKRIGVVAHSTAANSAAAMLLIAPRKTKLNLKVFNSKAEALQWLM